MRDYNIVVPSDIVAANTAEEREFSSKQIKNVLKGDIRESTEIDLAALKLTNSGRRGAPDDELLLVK
jgi:hypothetical protein